MRLPVRTFTQLVPKNTPDSFLKRLKQKFITRPIVYRILMVSTVGLTIGTYYLANTKSRNPVMVLSNSGFSQKYYQPSEILERGIGINKEKFYVIGIVKPGSMILYPGTMKHSFVVTDFIHEIKVYFEGVIPETLREEETSRIQGEFVNEYNPIEFIATFVEAPHDAETTKVSYQARSRDIDLKRRPIN